MTNEHHNNIIGVFAQHKVAANLLMILMLMGGAWSLARLNTQFLPNFALDIITVRVIWSGASAEDVETSITRPIEQELRSVDYLRKMTSTSAKGVANITLEYEEGTDMGEALDRVKEKISLLRNLPRNSEKPEISRVIRYEQIARVLITGPEDPNELRHLAHRFERELLARGIGKVDFFGLPEEEIAIQIATEKLEELGLTLEEIGQQISQFSNDVPAGSVGRLDVARQLRSLEQRRDELGFTQLPVIIDQEGRYIQLSDIATVERRPQEGEIRVTYQGKPAVELVLQRTETSDALKSAQIIRDWLDETRPTLPPNIELFIYDEVWEYIDERITLLLKNGAGGLILVVAVLFLFLNARVAFWVAAGIPISIMGMLTILYAMGGSINMISLFAMIMALGVIVDDAIVVGEDAFTHYQKGEASLMAAEGGAQRMLAPVTAASLTTISAFLPLMLIGGVMGNVLFDIPFVMICVLLASLIECFLVLPGHLRHTFLNLHKKPQSTGGFRDWWETRFDRFRNVHFRRIITTAVNFRWQTFALMLAAFALAIGLLAGNHVKFTFFPSPDGTIVIANVQFAAGTAPKKVDEYLAYLEKQLYAVEEELGEKIVKMVVNRHGMSFSSSMEGPGGQSGDQFGAMTVELISPDKRETRNKILINKLYENIERPAGLENFSIVERQGGPPGRDIEIRFYGEDLRRLKSAVLELADKLKTYPGVSAIEDDMPFGQEEWVFSLTPQAQALGLTVSSVGQQLRAAFDGYLAQIFQDDEDEVEVRVVLPNSERYHLANLENFTLQLPNQQSIPFSTAVDIRSQRGFAALRHAEGRLAAKVLADVDKAVTNANEILEDLEKEYLPQLIEKYGLEYSLEGRAADQRETFSDMLSGLTLGVSLMYLILAWQFGSYGWPLVVMSVIPFGLVGALFGHWLLGLDLTILSLFGFFGLSGIVVNDSIVLVTFYRHLREAGTPVKEALIEASCQRLRAVLLTSLTTIFGLLPLLFETSLQAQFLIPMATSISFGLVFSTFLVLLGLPSLLSIYERRFARNEWVESKTELRPIHQT